MALGDDDTLKEGERAMAAFAARVMKPHEGDRTGLPQLPSSVVDESGMEGGGGLSPDMGGNPTAGAVPFVPESEGGPGTPETVTGAVNGAPATLVVLTDGEGWTPV